ETVSLEEIRLCAAAGTPLLEVPGSALLIDRRRNGSETKSGTALRARARHEPLVAPDSLVEVIENRRAVDQVLSIVEHQDRDFSHRIECAGASRVGIAIEVVVLIGDRLRGQRYCHPPCKRREVRSKELHAGSSIRHRGTWVFWR